MNSAGGMLTGTGRMIVIAVIAIYLGMCLFIGFRTSKKQTTAREYFIANKNIGLFFLFFTCWGSFCGAGNFIGFAGSAAVNGIDAYWSYLGDAVLGYVVFSLFVAPHLSKFDYYTMPQYISHYLCGNDIAIRRISGVAAALCNIAISGIQIRGLGYLLNTFLGLNYYVALVFAATVLIIYTSLGGMEAVVQTDAIQGFLQVIGSVLLIYFGLKLMNFDFGWLTRELRAQDPALVTPFAKLGGAACLSAFLTGFLGDMANPIMWNRAFIAKDAKTATLAFRIATVIGIVATGLVMTFGLVARIFNSEVGDQATYWLVMNKMPYFMVPLMTICFMGAIMSTADTHMNAGVANIVCDCIDPEEKEEVKKVLFMSRSACYVVGIIGLLGAAVFPSILTLSFFGLTVVGGTIFPVFIIGNLYRNRKSETFQSNLSIKAVKIGMVAGTIAAIIFDLVPVCKALIGGGIIPGILTTTVVILVCNQFFKPEYPIGGSRQVTGEAAVNHMVEK